jgi:hypothetical protein
MYAARAADVAADLLSRKEFYALKHRHRGAAPVVRGVLETRTYQQIVNRFISPNTPYGRLLIVHDTGAGKTVTSVGCAIEHIGACRAAAIDTSVFIIGFEGTRRAFMGDLLKHPTLGGFVSPADIEMAARLMVAAKSGLAHDIDAEREHAMRLRRRLTNRRGNGMFRFIGYKALINHLFGAILAEDADLWALYKAGKYDRAFMATFAHSMLICDEFHDVYNSKESNNWGIVLRIICDHWKDIKMIALSATPLNNVPREVVDLIQHLRPNWKVKESDYFTVDGSLKQAAPARLREAFAGHISYLVDRDPSTFPARSFVGDAIKGIPSLRFVRCVMEARQRASYDAIVNNNTTLVQESQYVLDYALPAPPSVAASEPGAPGALGSVSAPGIYRAEDVRKIATAPPQWKAENAIDLTEEGIVTGECLRMGPSLRAVSCKYDALMHDIMDIIRRRGGKCLVFHNYVSASGAEFIREVFLRNGILDSRMAPVGSSICVLCGNRFDGVHDDHEPRPVRFVVAHSSLDATAVTASINAFISPSNVMGDEWFILVGTPMIRQSYDLRAVCNVLVLSRPDTISRLLQIIGRAARGGSHVGLPQPMWHVYVRLYVASLGGSKGHLSYEENKYREKMADYGVIQQIEKIMHEAAIDGDLNRDIIEAAGATSSSGLNALPYAPAVSREYAPSELNLATYRAYYAGAEVRLAMRIIRRAFAETSPVWKYADLAAHVRSPPHSVEYDTSLISDGSIVIALSRMLGTESTLSAIYGDDASTIKQVGDFYMMVPPGRGMPVVDAPYRAPRSGAPSEIGVSSYIAKSAALVSYEQRKATFYDKYRDVELVGLESAICDYGAAFHIQFMEETITYIFNQWTQGGRHSDLHAFYFKMLYYYDVMGFVIFADTTRDYVYSMYADYIVDTPPPKGAPDINTRNLLRLIERNISKASCEWCPQSTKDQFEQNLAKSMGRLEQAEITPTSPELLPVGHFLGKVAKFYHPARGWFVVPEYTTHRRKWTENPIIIGFDVKIGIHVRFKLRKPAQLMAAQTDARRIEKGSACVTQDKKWLIALCGRLNIKTNADTSVVTICQSIRARLMHLELLERARGSDVKFYYNHFET